MKRIVIYDRVSPEEEGCFYEVWRTDENGSFEVVTHFTIESTISDVKEVLKRKEISATVNS